MALPPALTELADTYPLPSNATFKGGITKLLNFATGLLGLTGNAPEARDALGIGPVISFRNRIRNPNFAVNQRAVSGSVVLAAGVYGHDGWKAGAAGCTYTFATSGVDTVLTITAGSLQQVIEGSYIEGGSYVMSWFGTAKGKIAAGSYSASGVTASSVTAAGNLTVEFNTGTLSRVQLEPGTLPTPLERKGYNNELAWCKRYLPAFSPFAISEPIATGQCTASTSSVIFFSFDVETRASPTGVIATGSYYLTTANGTATTLLSSFSFANGNKRGAICTAGVPGGLVAGNATLLSSSSGSGRFIFTGCEL